MKTKRPFFLPGTAYSPEYQKRHEATLASQYVAVKSPLRRGLTHIVEAPTFGSVAKAVLGGGIETLCGASLHRGWSLVPRRPSNGFLISCPRCRSLMAR